MTRKKDKPAGTRDRRGPQRDRPRRDAGEGEADVTYPEDVPAEVTARVPSEEEELDEEVDEDDPTVDVEELGRRFLEDSTESG